jgi:hypothetical protein
MHRTLRILAACVLALSVLPLHAEVPGLVLRFFPIMPDYLSLTGTPTAQAYFEKCGITFPDGASVTYDPVFSRLHHYNTEENQRHLGRILTLTCPSRQVQLDAVFVDFSHAEIEKLARADSLPLLRPEDILQLWKDGHGTLLHALKLITRNGVNAQIQSTPEHIYATEFLPPAASHTASQTSTLLPVPADFETRETGAIFNVTPVVGPDGYTIDVVMATELAADPAWHALAVSGTDAQGNELRLAVPQPMFHSRNFATCIVTTDGATQVLGGMANPAGNGITYLFLTVSLIESPYPPNADYAGEPPTGGAHALR